MGFDAWITFATFWALFVTTPGPNAVNCISNGMQIGFARSLWGVLAILCQATLFMWGAALGLAAMLVASPPTFLTVQIIGAGFLIYLGIRGLIGANHTPKPPSGAGSVFWKAFGIATINAKSLAGYIAAFSQFIDPTRPVLSQMSVIMPTALLLTATSYTGFVAMGAFLGEAAVGAVFNRWFRRIMAICFIGYGIALLLLALAPSDALL